MSNNDTFQRIRHTFSLDDNALIDIFALADVTVSAAQVEAWLSPDTGDRAELSDSDLASFLNGLITLKRGKNEGDPPKHERTLDNNKVLQKLRIALNLKADDTLEILRLSDIHLSKHELSALFRKADNKHFRACSDELLQGFLLGVHKSMQPSETQ
ncbi:MAG: DUF1456 family protein [Pseudomonadota bacterium]